MLLSSAFGAIVAIGAVFLVADYESATIPPQSDPRRDSSKRRVAAGQMASNLRAAPFTPGERRQFLSRLVPRRGLYGEESEVDEVNANAGDEGVDPSAYDPDEGEAVWDGLTLAFDRESRDPDWAGDAEQAIESALPGVLEPSGGRVTSLECRSSSCVVDVDWPVGERSPKATADLVHFSYKALDCASHIREDDDSSATLVFDCHV